jgi:glycosyltransferase involved in cell wall biosynthesis
MARRPRLQRPVDPGRIIFTIASANYLAHAATLMQSVRARHPEATRLIVLADAPRTLAFADLAADIVPCDALDIPLIDNMKLWYTCIEFNTALKPYAFRHIFAAGAREVIYLDPDIQLFAPMEEAFAALQDHSLVLTPHIQRPLEDGKQPDDHAILKSGVYNLGFLGARNDEETAGLLDWWARRTFLHCRVDVEANLFTDQRWMDLAPCFVSAPYILRDPGYNVAYWNIAQRVVQNPVPGQWTVDGRPLVFFHYSGMSADDPEIFSHHQSRFEADALGPVASLCAAYREKLFENSWELANRTVYDYGQFANGRPIEAPMRRWLLRAVDEERLHPEQPLHIPSEFFDEADETAAARGLVMTRLMYQLWLDRSDLRTVFDIFSPRGQDAFLAWFCGGEAEVDGRSIAAAVLLQDGVGREEAALPQPGLQPWTSVAADTWSGPAAQAENFLRGDLWAQIGVHDVLLPRQAALLWELRSDLQQAFPLHNLDRVQEFIGWAITAGCAEANVEPDFFSEAFIAKQTEPASIAQLSDDVPITEALRATRKVALRREYLNHWEKFPQDRLGRLSHGLWFAFIAPDLFNWPPALTAPVRAWFEQGTDISCGELPFNRAELALWEMRPDLQASFPLNDRTSCWGFLHWICSAGLQELQLPLDRFDSRLRGFLSAPSPRFFGLTCAVEMVYEARSDLRTIFDVETDDGRAGLHQWAEQHFAEAYGALPLGAVRGRRSRGRASTAPHRATLALIGQWSAPSGRGEDLRGSAAALDAAGFKDYVIVDRDSGAMLRPNGEALAEAKALAVNTAIVHLNAETALLDWEFLRQRHISAETSIGFWAWELERLPRSWRHAFSFYDALWASTNFARSAFAREALRPVSLMPMTVAVPEFAREARRPGAPTVFFFMFDFRSYASRKNPEGVVQAFLQAFPSGSEPVRLIIKTQGGASAPGAWRRLNALCSDPRIELRDVSLDRSALLKMIATADVFVSLHRSEGFGRGPAEAMLLERPVIATGYSGTADFISADCAYVVSHTLRPVLPAEYPGADGQNWAEPDIAEAAGFMRRCHENPKEAAELGRRGAARVQDLYNPRRVGRAMLAELRLTPTKQGRAPARA